MGSKNNPAARGTAGGIKKIGGKVVKPFKYIGKHAGHGNYMAAMFDGGEVIMSAGRPIPYADVIPDVVDAAQAAADAAAAKKKK